MSGTEERFSAPVYAPGMLEFWDRTLLRFYSGLQLRPPARLLDIGCGSGLLVERAAADGLDAEGVEPYWPITSERVRRGFAESLPYPDATFDVVVSFSVLEYLDAPRAIAEMARVLRSTGKAHIAIPEFADYPFLRSAGMRQRTSRAWLQGLLGPDWRIDAVQPFGLKLAVPLLRRLRLARLLPALYWRSYPWPLADMSFFALTRV